MRHPHILSLAASAFMMLSAGLSATAGPSIRPQADGDAVVVCGNARFTVLTDRLIRMEWAADGKFEDNATLAIVNRDLPVPSFSARKEGGGATIRTDALTLVYTGGRFTKTSLSVSFRMNGKKVVWTPGADDSGNLLGTTRTLDGSQGFRKLSNKESSLEKGVISRDGWAVIDESIRHLLVPVESDWHFWVSERPEGERQDLYIFAYGHDYKAALADYTKVAGRIPLPPKYTLGYWWSRYWAYTDQELLELATEMRERKVPMDVFIVDMDWHETWPDANKRLGKDEFGQRRGWTGYTWNGDLFPDPDGFLGELHGLGYKTALNLHPASGIRPYESCYKDFVSDYLSRTDDYDGPDGFIYPAGGYRYAGNSAPTGKAGYQAPVPFRLDQEAWADAYFNSVIHPFEKQGVDFWWLDWQQWMESKYVKGLSNTFWCNYAFFNDKVRQGEHMGRDADRPFIYHRWGGLGSHRYQLGFSGDTYDEWYVLEFLPYFTATASNVCYGYWGHDIGGHMQKGDHQRTTEPEMYTRWLQYGVFTPIFKTHSTHSANLERRIWMFPTHYEYMKEAIELRYALSPYIYDAARQAYDTGVSICRPLYYEYPEEPRAYETNQEFFFGDNILATVLCQPAGADRRTERKMWFPKGSDWYDMAHKEMHRGGSEKTLRYAINENPWFVRAGAVVPLAEEGIQSLQTPSNVLRLLVAPGDGKCEYVHYEDDGISQAYDTEYATTLISSVTKGNRTVVSIGARKGSYKGMPATRKLKVILEGYNGGVAKVTATGVSGVDSNVSDGCLVIDIPEAPASESISITVRQ